MDWLGTVILFTIVTTAILYKFLSRAQNYWKRCGIPYIEPEFFWGNSKMLFKGKLSLGDQITEYYREFKSRGVVGGGIYHSFSPTFIPVDLELIKNIFEKDFTHFINHGFYYNEKHDPLSAHLFSLEDDRWRKLRAKLTPTFTSSKMKMMFQCLVDCSTELHRVIKTHSLEHDPVDIKEILARFTTDAIGSCAFGVECNSLKDPDSEFRKYGKKIFELTFLERLKFILLNIMPQKILNVLHFTMVNQQVAKFFMSMVRRTIEYREKNGVQRKDFMQLMIQLKNHGQLADDDKLQTENNKDNLHIEEKLSLNEIAAQCFVFFMAGFESSSTTMTFAFLELALNQNIQDRLRTEILSVLERHNGQMTYDAIKEMTYLDMIVHETLRKHLPVPALPRICNKNYKIPGTNMVIEKGVAVNIPIQSVHLDPEYYPDPDKFDPERFDDSKNPDQKTKAFLAFGLGPRFCIGTRFGLLQTKIGIATIVRSFRVTLNSKTKTPIKYTTNFVITAVEGGVWLNITKAD